MQRTSPFTKDNKKYIKILKRVDSDGQQDIVNDIWC